MKRKNHILYMVCGLWAAALLGACKEDGLTPSYEYRFDTFMPDPEANDPTSVLRREFYAETGSYVFFNDTLRQTLLGYDYNGDPYYFTERVDLGYELGSTTTPKEYEYVYLSGVEEQRKAVEFLKDYVLVHFSEGLMPFSWLLVDVLRIPSDYGPTVTADAVCGERCVGVTCHYALQALEDGNVDALETEAIRIINAFFSTWILPHGESFGEFRKVSQNYYSGTFTYTDNADNTRILREAGFLMPGVDDLGNQSNGCYPDFNRDLSSYVSYALSMDEEMMEAAFGQYPLVMEKYRIMVETLTNLGYVF